MSILIDGLGSKYEVGWVGMFICEYVDGVEEDVLLLKLIVVGLGFKDVIIKLVVVLYVIDIYMDEFFGWDKYIGLKVNGIE